MTDEIENNNIINFKPIPVATSGDLITLCAKYIRVLQTRNYSPNTIKSYSYDLRQFVGFCMMRDVTVIRYVSAPLLDDFVDALINGEGNKPRTAHRKMESVKGLMKFALDRHLIERNPASNVVIKFDQVRVIAPAKEQLLKLINSIDTKTTIGLRDKTMYQLMYDAGLRVSGVLTLQLYDDKKPPSYCVLPNGVVSYQAKGGASKKTVVGPETMLLLNAWLKFRRSLCRENIRSNHLFITRLGQGMSRQNLSTRLKTYAKKVGLPDMHSHLFRHARAQEIYEKTGDLQLLQSFLGHSSIATTGDIYGLKSGEVMRHQIRSQAPLMGVQ